MKKNNQNKITKPEPYEDIVRLEKLDPYETLIIANLPLKNNQSIE